jgi:hypothetical protein
MKTNAINKQNANIVYGGPWTGLAGGNEVQLEDASDISNGEMSFGSGGRQLVDTSGADAVGLIEGTDYNYDELLDDATGSGVDIYDDSASGAFASEKVLRIVENGKNVTDATGLGLKVRAKDLSSLVVPPKDEVYVDPNSGKLVMPQPSFWCKHESINNLLNPEIFNPNKLPNYVIGTYYDIVGGKFGNCVRFYDYSSDTSKSSYYRPFGSSIISNKGTLSCWMGITYTEGGNQITICIIYIGDAINICTQDIYTGVNNTTVNGTYITSSLGPWQHIYIIWDSEGNLSGGKYGKVFLNNSLIWSSSSILNLTGIISLYANVRNMSLSTVLFDNLKIWDHVVSEDPSFEYNSGAGREDALHEIYGASNDYKPYQPKVGYYYLSDSTSPASLAESDAVGSNVIWTIR